MKKYTALLILALIGFSSQAQIKLNNISAGLSYWNRSYADADERAFLISYEQDDSFTKGGVLPFVSAEVGVFGALAVDGRVGLWTGDFESNGQFGDLIIKESIEQTIIPLSVGLLYRFDDLLSDEFNLYVGAGITRYFFQNKVSRDISGGSGTDASETFSGNQYGVFLKTGVEYYFTDALGLALEARYNEGYFNQTFRTSADADPERIKVSARGFEFGLSLRYRFSNPTAQTYVTEGVDE